MLLNTILLLLQLETSNLATDDRSIAGIAIAGCKENFQRLRSGCCRVDVVVGKAPTSKIFTCFDLDAGCVRFDRLGANKKGIIQGGKFIWTKKATFELLGTGDTIVRDRSSKVSHSAIGFFDVRKLGTFLIPSPPVNFDERTIADAIPISKLSEVKKAGSLTKITWLDAEFTHEIWFDELFGYGCIKYMVWSEAIDVKLDLETSWKKKDDVFVPVAMKFIDQQGKHVSSTEVGVEWEIVNGKVDSFLFTPESLTGGNRMGLYSNELGSMIFVKPIGGSEPAETEIHTGSRITAIGWSIAIMMIVSLLLTYVKMRKKST